MVLSGIFSGDERKRKEQEMREQRRLPPGQSLTLKWPVLHYGSIPRFDPEHWDFGVTGLVAHPLRFTWNEFNQLPRVQTTSDFHCVTRWSRFDNRWDGVAMREILSRAAPQPNAMYALITQSKATRRMSPWQISIATMFCWLRTTMANRSARSTGIRCG